MYQILLGVVVALTILSFVGLPVVSNQPAPAHAGTIIIGAG